MIEFELNPEAVKSFQSVLDDIEKIVPKDRLEQWVAVVKFLNTTGNMVGSTGQLFSSGDYSQQITPEQYEIIYNCMRTICSGMADLGKYMAETIPSKPKTPVEENTIGKVKEKISRLFS